MDLPASAPCVVVGGGIAGAALASHLADLGMDGVVLLEREAGLGEGATAKSAGAATCCTAGTNAPPSLPLKMAPAPHDDDQTVPSAPTYRPSPPPPGAAVIAVLPFLASSLAMSALPKKLT